MKTALIGHTGFVGGNLIRQHTFDDFYNTKNIESIAANSYDVVVCAGMPAEKWKANQNPAGDRASLDRLMTALRTVNAQRFILISTVDVYPLPLGVDEASIPDWTQANPYGHHRRELEEFAAQHFSTLIVRLPALFGQGIKKNIVYDFLHSNRLETIHADSQLQFYGLHALWADIQKAQANDLHLLNLVTEPVTVSEVAHDAFGIEFQNRPAGRTPEHYDIRSVHAGLFDGGKGYIRSKRIVLQEMKQFVAQYKH